jgi:hypothetical protein
MKSYQFLVLIISAVFLTSPCLATDSDVFTRSHRVRAFCSSQDVELADADIPEEDDSSGLKSLFTLHTRLLIEETALFFSLISLVEPRVKLVSIGLNCLTIGQKYYQFYRGRGASFTDYLILSLKTQAIIIGHSFSTTAASILGNVWSIGATLREHSTVSLWRVLVDLTDQMYPNLED